MNYTKSESRKLRREALELVERLKRRPGSAKVGKLMPMAMRRFFRRDQIFQKAKYPSYRRVK